MPVPNPIILDALKSYFGENPEIPQGMYDLIKKLLDLQAREEKTKEGIDKLYDIVLGQFTSKDNLVEWSKKYVN